MPFGFTYIFRIMECLQKTLTCLLDNHELRRLEDLQGSGGHALRDHEYQIAAGSSGWSAHGTLVSNFYIPMYEIQNHLQIVVPLCTVQTFHPTSLR